MAKTLVYGVLRDTTVDGDFYLKGSKIPSLVPIINANLVLLGEKDDAPNERGDIQKVAEKKTPYKKVSKGEGLMGGV